MRGGNEIDPRNRALEQIVSQSRMSREEVEARFDAGYTVIFEGGTVRWIKLGQRA